VIDARQQCSQRPAVHTVLAFLQMLLLLLLVTVLLKWQFHVPEQAPSLLFHTHMLCYLACKSIQMQQQPARHSHRCVHCVMQAAAHARLPQHIVTSNPSTGHKQCK
jgi:hypothetical protein